MKTLGRFVACSASIIILVIWQLPTLVAAAPHSLLISELQTGGCVVGSNPCTEAAAAEFVELYNPSVTALRLTGWKVLYLSASGATTTTVATLSGTLSPLGYLLVGDTTHYGSHADATFGSGKTTGALAKTGGSIQVIDENSGVIDLVGWGDAVRFETKAAKAPAAGQALQRSLIASGVMADSDDNSHDFTIATAATPQGGGFTPDAISTSSGSGSNNSTNTPPTSAAISSGECVGVILNELLPNPKGTDAGHEFIELYNPTNHTIALDGCGLQTSASSNVYNFTKAALAAGAYASFYDSQTSLTLPNAAGGTVWLLNAGDELDAVAYPANMSDDQAWARFGNAWQATFTTTPSYGNTLLAVIPCPDGQYRSTSTGRCRSASSSNRTTLSTAPCAEGKERNPATNRCRNIVDILAGGLQACKSGQVRNPATNRCKSDTSDDSSLKPCQQGWIRNPDTNRCRKGVATASSNNMTKIQDVATATTNSFTAGGWLIAGFIIIAALAYAVYEWRQDIRLLTEKLKVKFAAKVPPAAAHHKAETQPQSQKKR